MEPCAAARSASLALTGPAAGLQEGPRFTSTIESAHRPTAKTCPTQATTGTTCSVSLPTGWTRRRKRGSSPTPTRRPACSSTSTPTTTTGPAPPRPPSGRRRKPHDDGVHPLVDGTLYVRGLGIEERLAVSRIHDRPCQPSGLGPPVLQHARRSGPARQPRLLRSIQAEVPHVQLRRPDERPLRAGPLRTIAGDVSPERDHERRRNPRVHREGLGEAVSRNGRLAVVPFFFHPGRRRARHGGRAEGRIARRARGDAAQVSGSVLEDFLEDFRRRDRPLGDCGPHHRRAHPRARVPPIRKKTKRGRIRRSYCTSNAFHRRREVRWTSMVGWVLQGRERPSLAAVVCSCSWIKYRIG